MLNENRSVCHQNRKKNHHLLAHSFIRAIQKQKKSSSNNGLRLKDEGKKNVVRKKWKWKQWRKPLHKIIFRVFLSLVHLCHSLSIYFVAFILFFPIKIQHDISIILNTKSQLNLCYPDFIRVLWHIWKFGLYCFRSMKRRKRVNEMHAILCIFFLILLKAISLKSHCARFCFVSDKATQSATLFDCDGYLNVY